LHATWPDLWLQLLDDGGGSLDAVGVLYPDWLRWEAYGDIQLNDPTALQAWLAR